MSEEDRRQHLSSVFAVENLRFVVEAPDPVVRELLDEVFADLQQGQAPSEGALTTFGLERDNGTWLVRIPRGGRQRASTMSGALALLLAGVNISALDASSDRLHLHAAAVSRAGLGAVLAAARGTGKTTTAATLVARGWSFITDETVYLRPDDDRIRGTARPLSIKPHGSRHLAFLESHLRPRLAAGDDFQFVSLGASGAEVVTAATPHVVVLLRRAATGPLATAVEHRLHPADTVVGLMEETLDSARYGAGALVRLAQLAARSHCARVLVGDPVSTAEAIERLSDEGPVRPQRVHEHPPSTAVAAGVVSVRIGDRAVVQHMPSGRLVALDEAGTRIWEHLGGWTPDGALDLHEESVGRFLDELRSLGLLDQTH